MNLLSDLRIGQRLGLAFAISIAFSLPLAACARTTLIRINDEPALMVEDRLVKMQQLEEVKDNITAQAARNVLLPDAEFKRKQLAEVEHTEKTSAALFDKLDASIKSDKGRQLMAAAAAAADDEWTSF